MSLTVQDITRDADLFRAAYPSWPHPEPDAEPDTEGRHAGGQTDREQVLEDRWRDAE